jgi:glycosyltransferase involved in cell wall biosynthesis
MSILLNVRSQASNLTGVQRYVQEMRDQLGDHVRTIAPSRHLGGIAGHLWEQSILPTRVGKHVLWSPANTGPLTIANQVVTIHDVATLDHPEWFTAKFGNWYRWLMPRLVKTVRRIITVSQFTKLRLIELTRVDESKIVVIPNGVNKRFVPRSGEEIAHVREILGIPTSRYVLSLGSLEPRKNLARLLDAWSTCYSHLDDDITLVVAGEPGGRRIFRDNGISSIPPRVHFTGFVSEQSLPALYSGAIVLVYPSVYEGFGLPVAEAMASGVVPIVSDCSSLPEVVGNAGIKVNPFDVEELAYGLVTICRNHSLRADLREKALRLSMRFRWESAARASMDVLGSVTC